MPPPLIAGYFSSLRLFAAFDYAARYADDYVLLSL